MAMTIQNFNFQFFSVKMAANFFSLKSTIILLVLLVRNPFTLGKGKRNGIFFTFPKYETTLQNMDLILILEDVAKMGCWIHLAEKFLYRENIEIQFATQIGSIQNQNQNSCGFPKQSREKFLTVGKLWQF